MHAHYAGRFRPRFDYLRQLLANSLDDGMQLLAHLVRVNISFVRHDYD